jgi:predicted transcriptional regulator
MQSPYEIAVKSVIPALRGMIARELIKQDMTQAEIAMWLGVTQPAVSKYIGDKRGRAIDFDNLPDICNFVREISEGIMGQRLNSVQVMEMIKGVTDYVMSHGYMCQLHYEIEPMTKALNCKICLQ